MKGNKCIKWVALALVVLGALNYGLWGFFQFDFIAWLFHGTTSFLSRVVYGLIGIAGLLTLRCLYSCKSKCSCGCSCCSKDKDAGNKTGCCR